MKGVEHTHPHDDRSAGELFRRGPTVVADGGERGGASRTTSDRRSDGSERGSTPRSSSGHRFDGGERDDAPGAKPRAKMRDVDHTPPEGESANRVFERGGEHGDADVVGDSSAGEDERQRDSTDAVADE